MKTRILLLLLLLPGVAAIAQYKPDDKRSTVNFTIGNFGFDINGSFSGMKGVIDFDLQAPGNGSMNVTVDASTVNTDNSLRDRHLKEEGYFDVKHYPDIHFVSSKITTGGKSGSYLVLGKLTIKGISKDLSIPFTAVQQNSAVLFKGSFKINRKDFGIGGTSTISNELEVMLNVYAVKS